jgi:hypothetical protein
MCVQRGHLEKAWPAETRRPRRSRRRALFEAAARLGRECWWVVGEQAGRKLHPKVESDISIDSESLELPRSDHERPAHDAVVGFQRGVGHPGVQQQAAHDAVALVAASAQACEAVPESPVLKGAMAEAVQSQLQLWLNLPPAAAPEQPRQAQALCQNHGLRQPPARADARCRKAGSPAGGSSARHARSSTCSTPH